MNTYDFTIKQGESFIQTINFKDKNSHERIVFLDGTTAKCQIRRHPGDSILVQDVECEVVPELGEITLRISNQDTANISPDTYYYDLALIEGGNVIYYLEGKFIVKKHVTEVV